MGTTTNYREGMEISGRFSPSTTAILTMEMQRGVCGDLATFRALQDAVADGVADRVGNLLDTARRNSFMVVHCIFTLRADRAGTQMDLPIMTAARKNPNYLLQGTDSVALMPELRQVSTDVVCERHHGVSPFSGTNLDAQLRQQGINTLIVVGVSLNLGILGLAIEAVNLGYSVVIAADAVAGFPAQYAQDVLRHSLIAITEQATVTQIIAGLTASSATDPTHK